MDFSLAEIAPLGGGALFFAFVFRTLWRQEDGWKALLTEAKAERDRAVAEVERLRRIIESNYPGGTK